MSAPPGERTKVALIVDEFPFPPRNGVTIPTSQMLSWMIGKGWEIDLFVLSAEPPTLPVVTPKAVSVIHVPRYPCSAAKRIKDEVFLGIASFLNWDYPEPPLSYASKIYDLVVCSPISALDFPKRFEINATILVAAINDVYTAVLRTDPFGSYLARAVNRLRSIRMASIEARALQSCEVVLVQTQADIDWAFRIGGVSLRERCRAVHNAASEDLVSKPVFGPTPSQRVLFIADLSNALYQRNIEWLLESWKQVLAKVPQAKLRIVGKGLETNRRLHERLRGDSSVELPGFVENLADAYEDVRVVAAPIFKTYGFINKVAEAAAFGVPVVGDRSAFNGMNRLIQDGGGVVGEEQGAFASSIIELLTNDVVWSSMAIKAKSFAYAELTTAALFDRLNAVVGATVNASRSTRRSS